MGPCSRPLQLGRAKSGWGPGRSWDVITVSHRPASENIGSPQQVGDSEVVKLRQAT